MLSRLSLTIIGSVFLAVLSFTSLSQAQDYRSDVYETGAYDVKVLNFSAKKNAVAPRPPVKTRVFAPDRAGVYPLVLWFNCFMCTVDFQDQLMTHIASHGFVVVTAEFHSVPEIATTKQLSFQDADRAEGLFGWLSANLDARLAAKLNKAVRADTTNVGVVAYSSGAKVAWLLALDDRIPVQAMVGIMPVDNQGDPFGLMPEPSVLDEPFELKAPTLVLGTGYDPVPRLKGMPACGPAGHNHEQFYALSASPAWHVLGVENGHMDVLDSNMDWMASLVCPSKRPKQEMRSLTKGMTTAFLRAALQGENELWDVLTDIELAPTQITAARK